MTTQTAQNSENFTFNFTFWDRFLLVFRHDVLQVLLDLSVISDFLFLDRVVIHGLEHMVRGVAHTLLGIGAGDPGGQHCGGVDMAQVMEPVVLDAGFFADSGEAAVNRFSGQIHDVLLGMRLGIQQSLQRRRNMNAAGPAVCFCGFFGLAAFSP